MLVIYSFNESRLVTVWAGFSTKWYGELFRTRPDRRRLGDAPRRADLVHHRHRAGHAGGAVSLVRFTRFNGRTLFSGMVYAPLGDAGGDHRPVAAAAVRRHRPRTAASGPSTLAHITFSMCFVAVVVQSRLVTFDRSLEEAAQDLGCPPFGPF
jgi:putrescine transport system permease protein